MPRILIADDTPHIRSLLTSVLRREGWEVIAACDGAEALELAYRERPDAVILDIAMPLMDGIEALERMVSDGHLAQTPVMILTSNSQADNVQRALALGAKDFVVKPFDPLVLRERVDKLLAHRTAPSESTYPGDDSSRPELRVTPKILVVDDQPEVIATATRMLKSRFDVVTARTGAGALAVAARQRPDLVLMDLTLPLVDGPEALRRLRSFPLVANTKVLAMATRRADEQESLRAFDGVVYKPLDRAELIQVVTDALSVSGLLSFVTQDRLVTLRVHASPLWDAMHSEQLYSVARRDDGRSLWGDWQTLNRMIEQAFGRMVEQGYRGLVVDLEELADAYEHQLGVILTVVKAVLERARDCRIEAKVAAPHPIHMPVRSVVEGVGVEVCWRLPEATHALRRALGQHHPSSATRSR